MLLILQIFTARCVFPAALAVGLRFGPKDSFGNSISLGALLGPFFLVCLTAVITLPL
jgi:hypothetical protein